jgi:hypothetical protein
MKSTKRVSPILGSVFLLSVFMLLTAVYPALGETLDETINVSKVGTQYKVNFTGGTAANSITLNLTMYDGQCENIKYANGAGGQITVRNTSSPVGHSAKPDVVVATGQTSSLIPLCCRADEGQWLFEVGDGPGGSTDAVVTVNVTCEAPVPTLSEWALIVFTVLILSLMLVAIVRYRRRANAAQAW